jgi:hypothetical protein
MQAHAFPAKNAYQQADSKTEQGNQKHDAAADNLRN